MLSRLAPAPVVVASLVLTLAGSPAHPAFAHTNEPSTSSTASTSRGGTPIESIGAVRTWQLPRVPGATHELAITGDVIWVTQYTADRVLRIRVRADGSLGSIRELQMPPGSVAHGIDATRDFAWITLEKLDQLVGIDARGRILRTIQLPTGTGPHAVLRASDGSLWYAGKEGSVIGHVDTAGGTVLQAWELPAASLAIYLAEAPDGSVWFTELVGSAVGRVKDGTLTRIAIPGSSPGDASARPIAIDVARDGTVWFSTEAGNSIGRLPARIAAGSDAGLVPAALRMTPLPTANSTGAGLTIAEDGTVWVQTTFPFGLVRYRDGELRQFTIPSRPVRNAPGHPVPHRVHEAADGSLWFTDLAGDRLGRFIPDESPTRHSTRPE
jgi:virginiamycin B lyase